MLFAFRYLRQQTRATIRRPEMMMSEHSLKLCHIPTHVSRRSVSVVTILGEPNTPTTSEDDIPILISL